MLRTESSSADENGLKPAERPLKPSRLLAGWGTGDQSPRYVNVQPGFAQAAYHAYAVATCRCNAMKQCVGPARAIF